MVKAGKCEFEETNVFCVLESATVRQTVLRNDIAN
jgi:hypothetical protein